MAGNSRPNRPNPQSHEASQDSYFSANDAPLSELHRPSIHGGIASASAGPSMPPLPALPPELASQAPAETPAIPVTAPNERYSAFGRRRHTLQHPPVVGAANPADPAVGGPAGTAVDRAADRDRYNSRIVDFLDVVDPEVATLSSITNIQNSLFVPSLGKWVNRRPTFHLPELPPIPGAYPTSREDGTSAQPTEVTVPPEPHPARSSSPSLSSVLSEPRYAILPEDASLQGWTDEDIKKMNDYVRHMLHSRRSKAKQRLRAFGRYCSKPLGFLVTLYATLITLFGLAWVLFLIGWIYVGERQLYVINVIDYVLVALFAVVGDGLAPFRAIDTYHMIYVAHYHRKTWKQRKKLLLPQLKDHNDLPTAKDDAGTAADLEAQAKRPDDEFFPVLSDKEQERLVHHQTKLAKSHTFYKPHETETHRAFPLRLLIAVVLLLDLHSCLQIALGVCTWGIAYEHRPAALTTTILCCSIATNIAAGVLISIGDRRTRKHEVLDRLLKQDLTEQAMRKVEKKKAKKAQREEERHGGDESGHATGTMKEVKAALADKLNIRSSMDKERTSSDGRGKGEEQARPAQDSTGKAKDEGVGSQDHMQMPGGYIEEEQEP